MSDLYGALRTRLTGATAVAAIAGARVYWSYAAQDAALPYVVLTVVSDPRPEHLKGYSAERQTRVQADCMAAKHLQATDLAAAVIAAVEAPATVAGVKFGRTSAEGPRDLGGDVAGVGFVHRASVDLLVQHKLA